MKLNILKNTIRVMDGRKVLAKVDGQNLTPAKLEGVIAGADAEETDLEKLVANLEAAIATAVARRGSVIPNGYREQYGAEQSCGDEIAKVLTAAVTKVEGKKTSVDLDATREIAAKNGVEDRFDAWLAKDLNPGMVRMNLGNVLRGMARRGDEVTIGDRTFCDFAD